MKILILYTHIIDRECSLKIIKKHKTKNHTKIKTHADTLLGLEVLLRIVASSVLLTLLLDVRKTIQFQ